MHYVNSPEKDIATNQELLDLGASKLDIWRYYSERADAFVGQLWATGTWLFGVVNAVLALPFIAEFIIADTQLRFIYPPLTVIIYLFGLLLCAYSYAALTDIREHIERNWERADLARTGEWEKANWRGRKLHGWLILLVFGVSSVMAFLTLIVMAIYQAMTVGM